MRFISFKKDDIDSMVNDLNNGLNKLSFDDNFNGVKRTFLDVAAGELIISHGLKKVPSYRIILSQDGGTYITDNRQKWNDKSISLNIGSNVKRLEIFIGV